MTRKVATPAGRADRYVLVFDGGSLGNPGPAYGTFRIQRGRELLGPPHRLNLGNGTNNEAEYGTLIAGLKTLRASILAAGERTQDIDLEIRGDSLLVVEQLNGRWKVRDSRMRELHAEAKRWMDAFRRVRLVHQPRRTSVRLLGH